MKKVLKWLFWPTVIATVAVGSSLFNGTILLKLHAFDYYLTRDGVKLLLAIFGIETILLTAFAWAIGRIFFTEPEGRD